MGFNLQNNRERLFRNSIRIQYVAATKYIIIVARGDITACMTLICPLL